MNIYVGNLSYEVTERDLREEFEEFGAVDKATVITDRDTGRSKGFGFIEMADQSAGQEAIEALNGKSIHGRAINVNEARPREDRRQTRKRNW